MLPAAPVMGESRGLTPARDAGALNALFSRVTRASDHAIVPINEIAADNSNEIAADTDAAVPAFYCVHSLSGAGGTDYRQLARLMPAVRFYGIQAPPRRMRDPAFGGSVDAIADYYADALVKFQPEGPFLLGGWSAGAIIGLEIAQKLRRRGRHVALFAAIDAAPENTGAGLRFWHPRYLLDVAGNLVGWTVHDVLSRKGAARLLGRRALSKAVARGRTLIARIRGEQMLGLYAVEGFMDLSRYPAEQKLFMKRLYNSLLAHTPADYPGDVVVYEAKIKPLFALPQVGRVWRRVAPRSVVVDVEGTHLSILHEPYARTVAEDLQQRIAAAAPANRT
jgi:thioesterase domain-containing protein